MRHFDYYRTILSCSSLCLFKHSFKKRLSEITGIQLCVNFQSCTPRLHSFECIWTNVYKNTFEDTKSIQRRTFIKIIIEYQHGFCVSTIKFVIFQFPLIKSVILRIGCHHIDNINFCLNLLWLINILARGSERKRTQKFTRPWLD